MSQKNTRSKPVGLRPKKALPTTQRHLRQVAKPDKSGPAAALLAWYDKSRRDLPWRARRGETPDPYRVWLSEIMLQQTTVAAVEPRFQTLVTRWPSVQKLAAATQDEVLGAWAGLGYYSRARNLHRAAQMVVREHNGTFPDSSAALRGLPGIGAYTAAAIAAIAYQEPVAAMDANAERVIARLYAVQTVLPKARAELAALAAPLVPKRAGDFAQALMDLGSQICTSRNPECGNCPLAAVCQAHAAGQAEELPRKSAKRARPTKRGTAFVALDSNGSIYVERRPEKGLLGAMLQPPLGEWRKNFLPTENAVEEAPFTGAWRLRPGIVRHGFTHFELELRIYAAEFSRRPNGEGFWLSRRDWSAAALPTVMRKIIAHAIGEDMAVFGVKTKKR